MTDKKSENPTWRTKKWVTENQVHNTLLDIEKEQGWTLLFDGKTLEGWHLYNKPDSTALSAWEVQDGTLFCNATDENKVLRRMNASQNVQNDKKISLLQFRGKNGPFC